jgi:hypothetical protein
MYLANIKYVQADGQRKAAKQSASPSKKQLGIMPDIMPAMIIKIILSMCGNVYRRNCKPANNDNTAKLDKVIGDSLKK